MVFKLLAKNKSGRKKNPIEKCRTSTPKKYGNFVFFKIACFLVFIILSKIHYTVQIFDPVVYLKFIG